MIYPQRRMHFDRRWGIIVRWWQWQLLYSVSYRVYSSNQSNDETLL